MANTFKMATKSSLVTDAVSNSTTNVLSIGSTATSIVLSVLISNKVGSSASADVYLVTSTGDDVYLIRNAPIPGGATLELINGNKIILSSNDILRARADTSSALDISVSYLEQTL